MSQSRSRRRAGLAVAALVAGTPLLATGAAYAQPAESGHEVVFSGGGLLGVSCGANPNRSAVTVPAESTLRVVNRTGYRATLLLDGAARGEIGKGSSAEVLFHRGPVRLGLKPHCVLGDESSVRVEVASAQPASPGPAPAGPSGPATGGGRTPASPVRGGAGETAGPATGGGRSTPAGPGIRPATQATAAPGEPAGGPGDDGIIGDGTAVPDVSGVDSTAAEGGDNLAAEPLASVEPLTNNGPIGLLALIATVCVLGVSVGAMRAIIAQRATRAGLA